MSHAQLAGQQNPIGLGDFRVSAAVYRYGVDK